MLVLFAATTVIVGRDVVRDAWAAMGEVSFASWLGLLAAWLWWTLLRASVQKWSVASIDFRTALLMSEAGEAAKWLPVGEAGSFAIRTSLGRSRGIGTSSLVIAFVLVGEALATGLWLLVGAAALIDVRRGTADSLDRAGLIGAGFGLTFTIIGAWIIVSKTRITEWLVRRALRVQTRIARRWPRAARPDLATAINDARREAAGLIRRRAAGLVVTGAAVYVASGSLLWLALRAVGGSGGLVSTLVIYMPVKAAVGFSPTPGGIGFTEAGLVGALVAAGVPLRRAVAGVAIYRLFTALVPLVAGSAISVWWLRRNR